MSFDPDGDQVQCRYGLLKNAECHGCSQPQGFFLDRASCTLQYQFSSANPRVFGFELVVEDFPRKHITLRYSDGSSVHRSPLHFRGKRQAPGATTPWWWAPSTTTPTTTTPWWIPTTSVPTTTTPWWTTSTRTTSTYPTTTTTAPTTTTTAPTTTTTAPTTTWWTTSTTTTAPTTTTTGPTITTTPPTTTTTSPTTTWWTTSTSTTPPTTTWWTTSTSTTPPTTTWWTTPFNSPGFQFLSFAPFSTPLSKLPLQFSLLVDPPVPSCHEGLYLPKLVYPTPEDGARIQAEVDKVVEIRVKAEVEYGRINDIIVSGPLNITTDRTTHDEFVIRWNPVSHNLWNHYPVCFAVESELGSYETTTKYPGYTHHHQHKRDVVIPVPRSGIYHSEMRCVLVDVREGTVQTNVICTEYTMTVELEKYSLAGLHEDHLHLNDPSDVLCSLQTHSNKTHIIGIIPLNSCGTQIEEDKDNLIFKNAITAFDSGSDVITRKHLLDVQFYCQYPKRGNVTLNFVAHRKKITVWDRGMGTFTYQFEFYPDETYDTMIDPNSYPLVYKIGTRIYMQIEATSSVSNTVLFVESCRASPYDTPNYTPTYSIIENGCPVDPTIIIHPTPNRKMFRFSLEAFKFIGMYPQVYISCSVLMCEAGNKNTRCSKGCVRSAWPSDHSGHVHRRKREAAIQSQNHFVSQGPLRLRSAAEESGSSVTLNLNLVFIAGCLLAAVVVISILVLYRNRQGTVKYHPLLLTDTYTFE